MYENRIMMPVKIVSKRRGKRIREHESGDKFEQSTIYTCMEILQ
jgi:hypothetical protein